MTVAERVFALEPSRHLPHALHGEGRVFRETNCYVDLWIEALHALGLEPRACLGCALAIDFEGDQWTFFKPSHRDLEDLYGIRVEELSVYRPLAEQIELQVARRRMPLVEVDAFFLPDTYGSDYRQGHAKTTIGISSIDRRARRLRYFHNAAFAELEGEDFDGLFGRVAAEGAGSLPPYCEIAKLDRARALGAPELRARSIDAARRHFAARPLGDPFEAHLASLPEATVRLAVGGLPAYHAYGFASLRQLGAAAELLASYLVFIEDATSPRAREAAEDLLVVAAAAKTLLMKLARVARSGHAPDFSSSFAEMSRSYQRANERIAGLLGI